jgi:phosphatidylinositol-3-phosphatase
MALAACVITMVAGICTAMLAPARAQELPRPDHVVLAILENHSLNDILDNGDAPFLGELARQGAVFTRSFAVARPSQPNYFALFSGSTFEIADDGFHLIDAPTLAGALKRAGKTFTGYVERGSPRKHNPWESFRDSRAVEQIGGLPGDLAALPTVSFVVPNLRNDMHDGSIAEGDRWLREHLGRYAEWCAAHNSLLIITFDEPGGGDDDPILTIFIGAGVTPGRYEQRIDHYAVLRTIEAMYDLPPLARSAQASPITAIWSGKAPAP